MQSDEVGRIVAVTAAGKIDHALACRRALVHFATKWHHFNFDDYLKMTAWDELRDTLSPEDATSWDDLTMLDVLNQPESVLQILWGSAFQKLLSELDSVPRDEHILLSMHASWYSLETTSLLTCIETNLVAKLAWRRNPRVINLIDDIYDLYRRLADSGELFDSRVAQVPAVEHEIQCLLQIANWRLFEFRTSQVLSHALRGGLPYMVAIKHPLMTFASLIEDDSPKTAYLSHPISEIRRLDNWDESPLLEQIQAVSAAVREDLVLFEPTAIDEYRLNLSKEDPRPILTRRWPEFVDISGNAAEPILDYGLAGGADLALAETFPDERTSALVLSLKNEINHQINWRDRQLVSQSEDIIVICPFAKPNGESSGGVRKEIELQTTLRNLELVISGSADNGGGRQAAPRGRMVIFHPDEAEHQRQLGAIAAVLMSRVRTGDTELTRTEAGDIAKMAEPILKYISNSRNRHQSIGRDVIAMLRREHSLRGAHLVNRYAADENLGEPAKRREQRNMESILGELLCGAIAGNGKMFADAFESYWHAWEQYSGEFRVLITSSTSNEDLSRKILDAVSM